MSVSARIPQRACRHNAVDADCREDDNRHEFLLVNFLATLDMLIEKFLRHFLRSSEGEDIISACHTRFKRDSDIIAHRFSGITMVNFIVRGNEKKSAAPTTCTSTKLQSNGRTDGRLPVIVSVVKEKGEELVRHGIARENMY